MLFICLFLDFQGRLCGFKGDLIHSYNKHEVLDHIKGFVRHTKVSLPFSQKVISNFLILFIPVLLIQSHRLDGCSELIFSSRGSSEE